MLNLLLRSSRPILGLVSPTLNSTLHLGSQEPKNCTHTTADESKRKTYYASGPSEVLELSPYSAFFTTQLCKLGSRPNHTLEQKKELDSDMEIPLLTR